MTSISPCRKFGVGPVQLPLDALILLLLVALAGIAAAFASKSGSEVTVALPQAVEVDPLRAAALVARTSASPSQLRASGDQARLLNAALPFSADPVEAATRFAVGQDGLDYRRALLCLTQAVYYEAGFEPADGRRAVAQVVINRMRHPAFPKSICGVVYQGSNSPVCQFSFVCDGSLHRAPAAAAWREARDVAEAALNGYVAKGVGAATHYHADYVAPYWAPSLSKIQKIGAHIFYRWPGAWGRNRAFTGRYIGEPVDPAALRPVLKEQDVAATAASEETASAEIAGPAIARAPTDVGGLLDVSKGWTLNIPVPSEVEKRSAQAIAQQERSASAPARVATAAAPVVAAH